MAWSRSVPATPDLCRLQSVRPLCAFRAVSTLPRLPDARTRSPCSRRLPTTFSRHEHISAQAAGGRAATSSAGGEPPGGEFEFEDTGEFEFAGNGQREGEYYETDNEFFAAPGNGRSGRWVRRGGKIILTGL